MLKKWRKYFCEDLWNFQLKEISGWRRFYFKWLRIADRSIRGFFKDRCSLYVSSLTFYTLLSIVPLFAVALAIARIAGLHEHLQSGVLERFQEQKEVFARIIDFSKRLLDQVHGGIFAVVGVAFLFWTVAILFKNMEVVFNQIWHVEKGRNWKRVLTDYLALIFLGPLLFLLSSSFTVFLVTQLEGIIPMSAKGILFAVRLIPYGIFWILFTLIFLFLPNTRVRFSSAAIAGVITAVLYLIVQGAYIYFQVGASRYGAIYGSFAALPLFLIWLQLSWVILLFGGEISHAHQTLEARKNRF